MSKLLIIQEVIKHYRAPVFHHLNEFCEKNNHSLEIIYSEPVGEHLDKQDNVELPESYGKKVKASRFFGNKVFWQHGVLTLLRADLVIVEQANRPLLNYLLIILSILRLKRFAFWGHGKNLQSKKTQSFSEKVKAALLNTPDWWFAYTESTKQFLIENGVKEAHITNVNNSIDTRYFKSLVESVSEADRLAFKASRGIKQDAVIGLFCGSLYVEKQLDFLVSSCVQIKANMPDFHLVIAGTGPEEQRLLESIATKPWISYCGAIYSEEKATVFASADVLLNPGLVGLGILDGFAAGLPMLTTKYPNHSPEISYLKAGVNGDISDFNTEAYAAMACRIFSQPKEIANLSNGAITSSREFSTEAMAENIFKGFCSALALGNKSLQSA